MFQLDSYEEAIESFSLAKETTKEELNYFKMKPKVNASRIRKRKPCHVETKNLCKFFGSRLYQYLSEQICD